MSVRVPVTVILSLCLFLTGLAAAAVTPYRAIVAIDGLAMSNSLYAVVMTLSSIGTAAASVLLGYFSDRVADRRLMVIVCAVLSATAYGLVFALPNQPTYVIALCVILPFGGALFSQTFSYARAYFDQKHPGRSEFMMSALRSLFSLAWVVAPPLVGWIAASYSVFWVFAVASAALLACTAMFGLLFASNGTKIGLAPRNQGDQMPAAANIPRFRIVGIGGVALVRIALVLNLTALPLVLTKDLGGTLTDVGINASLAAALEVPFMLLWGWAATRWPKEPILIGNAMLYAAYMILMFFARSVQDVLFLQVLNAISTAALLSITISYMQEAIKGRLGLSTSLIDVVTVIAGLTSAGLFALLSSPESYSRIMLAGGGIGLAGAGLIGASVFLRKVPPIEA